MVQCIFSYFCNGTVHIFLLLQWHSAYYLTFAMAQCILSHFCNGIMHIFLLLQWHISPVLAWSHRSSGQWVFKVPSGNLIGDGLSHWWAWHHTKILNETRRKTLKSIRDNIPILNANNGLVCNKLHFQKKNEMKPKKKNDFRFKKKKLYVMT